MLQREDVDAANSAAPTSLRSKGMIVNETDTSGFRAHLQDFYARWKATYGAAAWGLLESRVGKLT